MFFISHVNVTIVVYSDIDMITGRKVNMAGGNVPMPNYLTCELPSLDLESKNLC